MGIYHYLFLSFTLLGSAAALFFYYKKSPNPRFRPSFGEMTLLSLLAAAVSCAISIPVANMCENPEVELGDSISTSADASDKAMAETEAKQQRIQRAIQAQKQK